MNGRQNQIELNNNYLDALRSLLVYNADQWSSEVKGLTLFAGTRVSHPSSQKVGKKINLPQGIAEMVAYLDNNKLSHQWFWHGYEGADKHLTALCHIAREAQADKSHFRSDKTSGLYKTLSDLLDNKAMLDETKITQEAIDALKQKFTDMQPKQTKALKK